MCCHSEDGEYTSVAPTTTTTTTTTPPARPTATTTTTAAAAAAAAADDDDDDDAVVCITDASHSQRLYCHRVFLSSGLRHSYASSLARK